MSGKNPKVKINYEELAEKVIFNGLTIQELQELGGKLKEGKTLNDVSRAIEDDSGGFDYWGRVAAVEKALKMYVDL